MSLGPAIDEIKAELQRVTYRNEENGWSVLKMRALEGGVDISAVGILPDTQVGLNYQLFGKWKRHPTFGKQFEIIRSVAMEPDSILGIKRFLASGMFKGIGDKTADKILEVFGKETLKILDNEPHKLHQVEGLGRKKIKVIIEAWREKAAIKEVLLFLNTYQISPAYSKRIIDLYGAEAIQIISRNPYQLAFDVRGIGFLKADKIAQSIGIEPDSPERVKAAIVYVMQLASERGHCYQTVEQVENALHELLGLNHADVNARMETCLEQLEAMLTIVVTKHLSDEGRIVYLTELLEAEVEVAKQVTKLCQTPLRADLTRVQDWLDRYTNAAKIELSKQQMQAIELSAAAKFFVLTGGPGVGKTTTVNAVIRLAKAMGRSVVLAAPTGRAAQRMSEVTGGEQAQTIHRLLEWGPEGFGKNADNPIVADTLIIDEASMLDIKLSAALLGALSAHTQVILVGDVDQLPAVSAGNVLQDLIESTCIEYLKLTEVFRQAKGSYIISGAHSVNQGEMPEFANLPDQLQIEGKVDLQFLECPNSNEVIQKLESILSGALKDMGFNPVRDVQVIVPMNRGDLGTKRINQVLQSMFNPPRKDVPQLIRGEITFRAGDKVIQCSNNYDLGVFNGDIGFIQNVGVDGGKLVVTFGDRVVYYSSQDVNDLQLAYAITIHKSQGSEFKVVIIPFTMQHYVMLQRNLAYTGLTRGRELAVFIGEKRALRKAVQTKDSLMRQTHLSERLRMLKNY